MYKVNMKKKNSIIKKGRFKRQKSILYPEIRNLNIIEKLMVLDNLIKKVPRRLRRVL